MSIYKEIDRNPSRKSLLSFGLIVLGGCGVFGALAHFKSGKPELALGFWIAGAAVLVLSFVPVVGRLLYIGWMAFGLTIGFFTAPVIMGVLYVLVIVPVAFGQRLKGRDLMRRKLDRGAKSYWEDYPRSDDPGSYVRQY